MNNIHHFGFDTKNFRILIAGLCINVFGFILMIGGGSEDPNTFNEEALFSPIRITLAPVFILCRLRTVCECWMFGECSEDWGLMRTVGLLRFGGGERTGEACLCTI